MSVDMRLISFKNGGKFAMSWIAGTNPKALRLNIHRSHLYIVDVSEVCEDIMESMRCKEDKISFRILFKLCFGTVRIFSEQVQHLYNLTQNFVCFNSFVMKQYSRKRTCTSDFINNGNKKSRIDSSTDIDITELLLESETLTGYSEDTFRFPNENNENRERKQKTTCIEIKQITIRQVSWDNQPPEEEDMFGEASQDERMLLSSLCVVLVDQTSQVVLKTQDNALQNPFSLLFITSTVLMFVHIFVGPQKTDLSDLSSESCSTTASNSTKIWNGLTNSPDHIRDAPTINKDAISEYSVESRRLSSTRGDDTITEYNENESVRDELLSLKSDVLPTDNQKTLYTNISEQSFNINEDLNSTPTDDAVFRKPTPIRKKRKRPPRKVDKITKLPKLEEKENDCYSNNEEDLSNNEVNKFMGVFKFEHTRKKFQQQELVNFKNDLKIRSKHDNERQLIIEEIFGEEYEMYANEFKIKPNRKRPHELDQNWNEFNASPSNEISAAVSADDNNNYVVIEEQAERFKKRRIEENENCSLQCSLDKIDPNRISFDFPSKGNQRSEWGKEGILLKLLIAWKSQNTDTNMNTIIGGATRINAALAFHTLLDLAGQQYIEILKDEHNSIKSIKMGPETIRKLNETFV